MTQSVSLKAILMTLGNRLVTEFGYDPALSIRQDPDGENTVAIQQLTDWINSRDPAQQILEELGFTWETATPPSQITRFPLRVGRHYTQAQVEEVFAAVSGLDRSTLFNIPGDLEAEVTTLPIRWRHDVNQGKVAANFMLCGFEGTPVWRCTYISPTLSGLDPDFRHAAGMIIRRDLGDFSITQFPGAEALLADWFKDLGTVEIQHLPPGCSETWLNVTVHLNKPLVVSKDFGPTRGRVWYNEAGSGMRTPKRGINHVVSGLGRYHNGDNAIEIRVSLELSSSDVPIEKHTLATLTEYIMDFVNAAKVGIQI